ncbi:MAG: glutamate-5-semialdehyde dehydrogenase [Thermodesulfobacteriota bacterium]
MSTDQPLFELASRAKQASRAMAKCPTAVKDAVLADMARMLSEHKQEIFAANAKDVAAAREKGLSGAMIDRLTVTEKTIASMAKGLGEVAALPDPVGAMGPTRIRENGLSVSRMRIPLGVILMIYESRPNVTVDAAGLCLKAGNAVILRGGSEAFHSNQALASVISAALAANGLPAEAATLVPVTDRAAVMALLAMDETIDLVIPRGGEGLIRSVVENSRIPVLKHYKGVCHVYVDAHADRVMAENIVMNAKVQRPGVCNAMETLLVHKDIADTFLPRALDRLARAGVEIRGCPQTLTLFPRAVPAKSHDFGYEFLELILAVRVVDDMDQAMGHIAQYGSQHTEAIVTSDYESARRFVNEVDASMVAVNASTRFNDGGELGLGAEIGISTTKLHAYGPMGLEELTAQKFVVLGNGQVRG